MSHLHHVQTLELSETVLSAETVKKAYRRLSLRWHPDKPEGDADRFRAIQAAYDFLKQPHFLDEMLKKRQVEEQRQADTSARARHKRKLAEQLQNKEREAERRKTEATQVSRQFRTQYVHSQGNRKPHQYPSNYVMSDEEEKCQAADSSSEEESRFAALRKKAAATAVSKVVIRRVHAQHLNISSDDD